MMNGLFGTFLCGCYLLTYRCNPGAIVGQPVSGTVGTWLLIYVDGPVYITFYILLDELKK